MKRESLRLATAADIGVLAISPVISLPMMSDVVGHFISTGSPVGELKIQGSRDDAGPWSDALVIPLSGAPLTDMFNIEGFKFTKLRAVYLPDQLQQVTTYTIDAALIAANVAHCVIDGVDKSAVFASSSDETLEALAVAIATHADVESAVVTVEGGDQLGADDRVITITSKVNKDLVITGSVLLGASQANVAIAETQVPSVGALTLDLLVRS